MAGRSGSTIKRTVIDKVAAQLEQLPVKPKEDFALREAIYEMRSEIAKVLKRGYSFDEVASFLSQNDIQIKGITLKQYLSEFRRKDSKRKSRSRKPKTVESGSDAVAVSKADSKARAKSKASSKAGAKRSGSSSGSSSKSDRTVGEFVEMPDEL